MNKLNKTNLNKLRIEHNRVVKKKYRVDPANQFRFDEWFCNKSNRAAGYYEERLYVEIPSNETISGNPYILEAA
tara:strand:- start:519 stop:740 length:222 start_codon:yes stop_codon:yes gene_type:complete